MLIRSIGFNYALLIGVFCAPGSVASGGEIPWKTFSSGQAGVASTSPQQALAEQTDARHMVVQFDRPITLEMRDQLEQAGVRLLSYLHENAFFAVLRAGADPAAIVTVANGTLVGVSAIEPRVKLHPLFNQLQTPEWAVVSSGPDPVIAAYILFHSDVSLSAVGSALIARYNGVVRAQLVSVNGLVIEAPQSAFAVLATEDAVQWIEPALPQLSELNQENRALTGADTVQAAPYSLSGAGVTVLVYDTNRARSTHVDFGGRLTSLDAASMGTHATHVAATIGGSGAASGGAQRGMAPGVTLLSYGAQGAGPGIFLYSNPGDLEADYSEAISLGADISNNSIGTNVDRNGFDCSLQGQYGVTDAVIDGIVRGSLSGGAPFRIVWAAGNERQGDRCDVEGFGDYYSSAPPAGAKNHLCIGAVNANDDSMTAFSSWGPTADGRLKPDFCAPGCQVGGDAGVTSASNASDTAYEVQCGTSMASPTVCGLAALLMEDYRAHFGGPDPRNSMLKVLFAQNAVDLGNTGPDYQFGYGSVRIQPTIDCMRAGNFTEDQVSQGGTVRYRVTVPPGTVQLKLTLAWDDPPATPNVIPSLINDLDLRVLDPASTQHFPWTLNSANPGATAVRTQADHINNIEQVVVDNPVAGDWTIEINAANVPNGPQVYSLASSLPLTAFGIRLLLPGGVPGSMMPGVGASFPVTILPGLDSIVAGTPTLHFRYNGGTWLTESLIALGGDNYQADLPAPVCGATPQFYVSAAGVASGTVSNPPAAPTDILSASVYIDSLPYLDTVETDLGWTVGAPGDNATAGIWNRMDPQITAAQPEFDHTPGGTLCWVTDGNGGTLGANDVDDGRTTLISPPIDATTVTDPILGYWRWYSNTASGAPNADVFTVDISNDNGGTWTSFEVVGPAGRQTSGGWFFFERRIADVLPPTSQMKLRFIADDSGTASNIEAAIDDVQVRGRECTAILADANHNGVLDSDEPPPSASLALHANDGCYQPGSSLLVEINMSAVNSDVVGGQFFLSYDPNQLRFDAAVPGDAPFTVPIYGMDDPNAGKVDYAVGIPFPGGVGVSGDRTLARIYFTFLTDEGGCDTAELVQFRSNTPPTRLTGSLDEEISSAHGNLTFTNLNSIHIDGTPPVITPPADITAYSEAATHTANVDPGQASALDACDGVLVAAGTRSDGLPLTDPYPEGLTIITWSATDLCGNIGVAVQNVNVLPLPCFGDLNNDRVVDLADLAILLSHYGETGAPANHGDLNGDTNVDLNDLAAELSVYGTVCP